MPILQASGLADDRPPGAFDGLQVYINVVVAGKQPALNYLSMDDAVLHCTRGLGIWGWAGTDGDELPDITAIRR